MNPIRNNYLFVSSATGIVAVILFYCEAAVSAREPPVDSVAQVKEEKVAKVILTPEELIKLASSKDFDPESKVSVSFRVVDVSIPRGPRPKGTELPIVFSPKSLGEGKSHFSGQLYGRVCTDIRRIGIFQPDKHFLNRRVVLTGKVEQYESQGPDLPPSFSVLVDSIDDLEVRE